MALNAAAVARNCAKHSIASIDVDEEEGAFGQWQRQRLVAVIIAAWVILIIADGDVDCGHQDRRFEE